MTEPNIFGDVPVQLSQEEMEDPAEKIEEYIRAGDKPKNPVSPEIAALLASLRPLVMALSDDALTDFETVRRVTFTPSDAERESRGGHKLWRERLDVVFFDTIISRAPPGEFDRFPTGWCSPDVQQIDANKDLRFFTGASIGNRRLTNLESPGGFYGDQTGVFRHARLHIAGSRLKKEHYAAFAGTVLHFNVGCKTMVTEPLEIASSSDVGIVVLAQQKLSDISVAARQNWTAAIELPDAAIRLLPHLEMLRLVTSWTIVRDSQ